MKYIKGHILPRRDLVDNDGISLGLGDEVHYRQTYLSMREWVRSTKPSVLKEHQRDGLSYGHVVDVLDEEDGIYVVIEMGPDLVQDHMMGRLRYVSAYCAWDFLGDDGTVWYAALPEVSMVSVPRFAVGQRPIEDYDRADGIMGTYEVRLAGRSGESYLMCSVAELYTPPMEDTMDREELMALIRELLKEVMAEAEAKVEEAEAEAEVEEAELAEEQAEDPAEEEADPVAMLSAQVEELRARLAEYEKAEAEAELTEAGVENKEERSAMLSLRSKDIKTYQTLLAARKHTSRTATTTAVRPRVALGLTGAAPRTLTKDVDSLSQLMKQGLSYADAKKKLGIH